MLPPTCNLTLRWLCMIEWPLMTSGRVRYSIMTACSSITNKATCVWLDYGYFVTHVILYDCPCGFWCRGFNHLPPVCWSTFWKQLGCRFDIMDNESYFCVFWHMQLYMSWYIRSFFGFTFLNILYVFKYSCTSIFHRSSLYTFYLYGV